MAERGAGRNRAVNEHFKQRTCTGNRAEARGNRTGRVWSEKGKGVEAVAEVVRAGLQM